MVKVDARSLTEFRVRFVRVCVEIDLEKPLFPSLTIFYC